MIFFPFYSFETGCTGYLFGCGGLGLGAVVDPRLEDVDRYLALATAKGLRLTHVIDTHVHADHASGGAALAERAGAVYALHRSADVALPFSPLDHGAELLLGNVRVRVLHTPGHTPESVCLLVADLRRGPDPWFVLTGDTLFVGSVGRPDLPGNTAADARTLYRSLHEELLSLPDDLEIFPAHFQGSPCGAGMSGKPSSTLGFEKRANVLLTLSEEDFVAALAQESPKPEAMQQILAMNRGR